MKIVKHLVELTHDELTNNPDLHDFPIEKQGDVYRVLVPTDKYDELYHNVYKLHADGKLYVVRSVEYLGAGSACSGCVLGGTPACGMGDGCYANRADNKRMIYRWA
jgi:hypothetical protein